MKTTKMALKIILALSLPLNVMASSNSQGASGSELSIESRLEFQQLKLKRDKLLIEIAKSSVAIQVLKDIADPTLLSFYKQNDVEIALGAVAVSFLSMATIGTTISGYRQLAPNSKLLPAFKTATGITIGTVVLTLGEIIHHLALGDDYRLYYSDYKNSSVDRQMEAFNVHKQRILVNTAEAQKLDQQINALNQ